MIKIITIIVISITMTACKMQVVIINQIEMKKTVIKNQFTYDHTKQKGEINTLPSETEPNQSLTIRQIMERYSRGIPVQEINMEFDEDPDHDFDDPFREPDRDIGDLTEIEEANKRVAEAIKANDLKKVELEKADSNDTGETTKKEDKTGSSVEDLKNGDAGTNVKAEDNAKS